MQDVYIEGTGAARFRRLVMATPQPEIPPPTPAPEIPPPSPEPEITPPDPDWVPGQEPLIPEIDPLPPDINPPTDGEPPVMDEPPIDPARRWAPGSRAAAFRY